MVAALVLQDQQRALDGADGARRDVAVLAGNVLGVVAHPFEHRAQVLQVEQEPPFLVGDPERDVEAAFLRVRQVHQAREQQRAHLGDGGADRVPRLAEQIPQDDGELRVGIILEPHVRRTLLQKVLDLARHGEARQVALHVGAEDGHAGIGEALGQHLQRHRLARAGGAGDEAVPVGQLEVEIFGRVERVVRVARRAEVDAALAKSRGGVRGHGGVCWGSVGGHAVSRCWECA